MRALRASVFFVLTICAMLIAGCSSVPEKHAVYTVEIKDMKFVPENIIVNKGDTIKWINNDMIAHDITEQPTKAWSSGPLAAGASWKMAIDKSADYYCSIHTVMTGKIEVN